ncbi:MAG: tripartite tricarboxylate transporter substrate binding protein [Betaproteobacteria bacterium]|nr:MAG: tripartite tricarboxylate transporter substrate binding protein [Betaproteobacteria bacterium]
MKKILTMFMLAAISFAAAAAEQFPTRPIRVIVPYAPGGNVDISARIIAPPLGEALGQTVVVDNRPGAGGNLGAALVAKATPDGYTLLVGSSGPLSVNPVIFKNLPYDSLKDFAPISTVQAVPLVLLASPKSGFNSVADLIAAAKSRPGKVTMASAGAGTTNHFAIELFASMAGVKVLHVPYKGSGPALSELLGGQVDTMIDQLAASIGYVKDGRLKVLAVTTPQRAAALPNVPTLDELGYKGYQASTLLGLLAPAGTPKPVVAKLNAAVRKVMDNSAVAERFRGLGANPGASSPEEFSTRIRDELAQWRVLVKKLNLKFE